MWKRVASINCYTDGLFSSNFTIYSVIIVKNKKMTLQVDSSEHTNDYLNLNYTENRFVFC